MKTLTANHVRDWREERWRQGYWWGMSVTILEREVGMSGK